MRNIFDRGHFQEYSIEERYFSAVEGRSRILLEGQERTTKTKVFLSHKHDDLEDLKGLIGFLEKEYDVQVYIDSMDKEMLNRNTDGKTATRIKDVIKSSDKFILLATDKAVESKWCNWELGFGDAHKFKDHIAIFPVKEKNLTENDYKGHEYMSIYPLILYYDGSERYFSSEKPVEAGYYWGYKNEVGRYIITPLAEWLSKKK